MMLTIPLFTKRQNVEFQLLKKINNKTNKQLNLIECRRLHSYFLIVLAGNY